MRHLVCATLLLFAGSAQAVAVVIDFEEFTPDVAINPPSGDAVSKGFFLDYLDEGLAGNPVMLNASSSPNGTQVYMNCPACVPVEQIDVSAVSGEVFDLLSIDVGATNTGGSFDFVFTGFFSGGARRALRRSMPACCRLSTSIHPGQVWTASGLKYRPL